MADTMPDDDIAVAAMMDDLGNNRMEELALDDDYDSSNNNNAHRQERARQLAAQLDPNANAWTRAVAAGSFRDDDWRGVQGLEDIGGGRLHAINRGRPIVGRYNPLYPTRRSRPHPTYAANSHYNVHGLSRASRDSVAAHPLGPSTTNMRPGEEGQEPNNSLTQTQGQSMPSGPRGPSHFAATPATTPEAALHDAELLPKSGKIEFQAKIAVINGQKSSDVTEITGHLFLFWHPYRRAGLWEVRLKNGEVKRGDIRSIDSLLLNLSRVIMRIKGHIKPGADFAPEEYSFYKIPYAQSFKACWEKMLKAADPTETEYPLTKKSGQEVGDPDFAKLLGIHADGRAEKPDVSKTADQQVDEAAGAQQTRKETHVSNEAQTELCDTAALIDTSATLPRANYVSSSSQPRVVSHTVDLEGLVYHSINADTGHADLSSASNDTAISGQGTITTVGHANLSDTHDDAAVSVQGSTITVGYDDLSGSHNDAPVSDQDPITEAGPIDEFGAHKDTPGAVQDSSSMGGLSLVNAANSDSSNAYTINPKNVERVRVGVDLSQDSMAIISKVHIIHYKDMYRSFHSLCQSLRKTRMVSTRDIQSFAAITVAVTYLSRHAAFERLSSKDQLKTAAVVYHNLRQGITRATIRYSPERLLAMRHQSVAQMPVIDLLNCMVTLHHNLNSLLPTASADSAAGAMEGSHKSSSGTSAATSPDQSDVNQSNSRSVKESANEDAPSLTATVQPLDQTGSSQGDTTSVHQPSHPNGLGEDSSSFAVQSPETLAPTNGNGEEIAGTPRLITPPLARGLRTSRWA